MENYVVCFKQTALLICAGLLSLNLQAEESSAPTASGDGAWLSPTALAATPDGAQIYIACATARQIAVFDTAQRNIVRRINLPAPPTGLSLSGDGAKLLVSCGGPRGRVCIVDGEAGQVLATIRTGHTAAGLALSPNGKMLYVCNQFSDDISAIDLATRKEVARIPVSREPVAATVTPDGKLLLVANHLPAGRSDGDIHAAVVSIIDTANHKVIKELRLPNGSTTLRDIHVSPDGRYACVAHVLARFHLPTTQVDRGWMNTNALTIIDLQQLNLLNTVLLDNVDSGAANPWAIAWLDEGKILTVTHAGTHELSVIEFPALLAKLKSFASPSAKTNTASYTSASRVAEDVPNDLAFLVGVRKRVKLNGQGPRASVAIGKKIYVANYFSDNLNLIDLGAEHLKVTALPLAAPREMDVLRRGEFLFNDATICFQGWQSCASCHSSDARVDSHNWDLLNDGLGNPKNTKTLLLSHKTPPAMSMSVRDTAETAVRAGIRHILFTVQPEESAVALDEWLKSLKPIPSPHLVKGNLSPSAQRGQALFMDKTVGCATCHTPGLFTDMKPYDVGTQGKFDKPEDKFDTPSLIETWRTAPYLHDGSAATIRDVLTSANPQDYHGKTSHLTPEQIYDLTAYVLSL